MTVVATPAADAVITTPEIGTPEYDAAMVAKADAVLDPVAAPKDEVTPPEADRPEWLDAKFKTPEEMAKAYSELAAKLGTKTEPEAQAEVTPPAAEGEAAEVVAKAGLDYSQLTAEFEANGVLSDESYKALEEKTGLSKDTVDNYIKGQQAIARESEYRAFAIAGGEEQYTQMVQWAASNLTPAEVAAYDAAVTNTSAETTALAVAGLKAKFVAARGSEPGLLNGGSSVTGGEGFKSTAEMTKAMSDPRYSKDPAYRKSVEQKVAISNIF